MAGWAIIAAASAVTWVRRSFTASPSDAAANCSAGQPAVASWLLARFDVEIGDRDDVQAAGQPRLRQEHGAELAGADHADRHRAARGLAFEQESMQVHRGAHLPGEALPSAAQAGVSSDCTRPTRCFAGHSPRGVRAALDYFGGTTSE
jgi:hypothetical protein